MINEEEVINVTHQGLNIYAHILSSYYPDELVLELKGNQCSMARNPFNENKRTLEIFHQDRMYFYRDTEMVDFKGNPFEFAFLHFGLRDQALLERIVKDMHLVVGQNNTSKKKAPGKTQPLWMEDDCPCFNIFYAPISNTTPGPVVSLYDIYRGIKSPRFKYRTQELRLITNGADQRKYKAKNFDYITPSGIFSKRSDKCLLKHSGLMVIDFDHITNLAELKNILLNDPFLEIQLMFVSPSGTGLKIIVAIDIIKHSHLVWFNSIAYYIKLKYGLEVDKSGKDISRACFLPWDPDVYIHPKYTGSLKN